MVEKLEDLPEQLKEIIIPVEVIQIEEEEQNLPVEEVNNVEVEQIE